MTSRPIALVLAGPNGAGKTTVSPVFVGPDVEFVNADIIGAELRREDPLRPGIDVRAGRIVSARLRALAAERKSFCFETNLASPGLVGRIDAWRADGYEVRLIIVSLPNVDLALARVAARVAAGGHDVPEETVRRRFTAGLRYFFALYRRRVEEWALFDNAAGGPVLLASGDIHSEDVLDAAAWSALWAIAGVPSLLKDPNILDVNETSVIDVPTVRADRLARHVAWQRLTQAAVARALDENVNRVTLS
jgi:predicted ABC-type ATPase